MITIKTGPMIKRFAAIYLHRLDYDMDEAERDVIEWVHSYVNGPWPDDLKPHIEATEQERLESIKKYITDRIDNSVTGRIKKLNQERKAA